MAFSAEFYDTHEKWNQFAAVHADSWSAAEKKCMPPSLCSEAKLQFRNPGILKDHELRVVLTSTLLPNQNAVEVPTYCFTLAADGVPNPVGHLHIRVGHSENLELYQGHIGYGVNQEWRGHHYAERASRLLLPFAAEQGLNPVWITCDPDNLASRRTCERLGGKFIEIVDVPQTALAYRFGARRKCRYRLDLPMT